MVKRFFYSLFVKKDKIALNKTEFRYFIRRRFCYYYRHKASTDGYPYIVSGIKQSKTVKFGAVFRIVPSETTTTTTATTNNDEKLDIIKQQKQQTQEEEKNNVISTITNTNTTAANTDLLLSNQKDSPPKKQIQMYYLI